MASPLVPLAPLNPLSSGPFGNVTERRLTPLDLTQNPDFGGGGDLSGSGGGGFSFSPGDYNFGSGQGCDPYTDPNCNEGGFGGGGFAPASGPAMGGNFPCDPSIDPTCCDPSIDPTCGGYGDGGSGGGGGGGGGVILVGGTGPATSSPGGNACGCGIFDVACRFNCTLHGLFASGGLLERLVVLILGLLLIAAGVYLYKPGVVINIARAGGVT